MYRHGDTWISTIRRLGYGVGVAAAKTGDPFQLLNPPGPPRYGGMREKKGKKERTERCNNLWFCRQKRFQLFRRDGHRHPERHAAKPAQYVLQNHGLTSR